MNQQFIYLASASPRRQALLTQIGIQCRVHPVDIDESRIGDETARDHVTRLAGAKGTTAAATLGRSIPVLAADTLVVIDGTALGKPRDREDAIAMLARLAGKTHEVLTAVTAIHEDQVHSALATTRVVMRDISATECEAYWDSGEPADKAGAYAIQGRGAVFVERIEGSYSGVIGLPLFETSALLRRCGVAVLGRMN